MKTQWKLRRYKMVVDFEETWRSMLVIQEYGRLPQGDHTFWHPRQHRKFQTSLPWVWLHSEILSQITQQTEAHLQFKKRESHNSEEMKFANTVIPDSNLQNKIHL